MYKAFLIKYGEIGIKGKNRYLFEYALMDQIKFSLRKVDGQFEVTKEQGRVYVEALTEYDYDEVIKALSRVFGIVAICPVVLCDNNEWSNLCQVTGDIWKEPIRISIYLSRFLQEEPIRAIRRNLWRSERIWVTICWTDFRI